MKATVTSYRIDEEDFMRMFNVRGDKLPPFFAENLASTDTSWRRPTDAEMETYVLDVLKGILEEFTQRTAEENLNAFETGWTQNLEEIKAKGISLDALRPRYFRGTKYLRYNKTLIVSDNPDLQYDLFVLARMILFWKYLRSFSTIYEFGCGSCANLLMLAKLLPDKDLVGLDWAQASVNIADLLGKEGGLRVRAERFDFYSPSRQFRFEPGSAVLTVHALEQVGERFEP